MKKSASIVATAWIAVWLVVANAVNAGEVASVTGITCGKINLISTPTTQGGCAAGLDTSPAGLACPDDLDMVRIAAGAFLMGSPATAPLCFQRETPQHRVSITHDFWMGRCPITQSQFRQTMGFNPSFCTATQTLFGGGYEVTDRQPAEGVSWFDAIRFCNVLSKQCGLAPCYFGSDGSGVIRDGDAVVCRWDASGYRLPTEAEWEYACRAGTTSTFYWGNGLDVDVAKRHCWFMENAIDQEWTEPHAKKAGPQPVGTREPNGFGLYDMCGNVRQWCWDWYSRYSSADAIDPIGPATGTERIERGSNFNCDLPGLRSTYREYCNPMSRGFECGFRVVRGIVQK